MIRFIATFSSFTISALNEINKDTVLINKLKNNLNTKIHASPVLEFTRIGGVI